MAQPAIGAPARISRVRAVVKALLGACALAVALGSAGALAQAVHSRTGLSGVPRQALTGVICLVVAVSLIVLLRRKVDRRSIAGLGLTDSATGLRTFGLGVAVTGGSAAVVFGAGTSLGLLEWGRLSMGDLLGFLAVNAVIALALEAFPEELVFRGYVFDALDHGLRRWTAFLGTVVLFSFAGSGSTVVYAAVGMLLGEDVPAPSFAPVGQDPISYAILYPIFGITLLIARITTCSLWTSIAVHLTYLTVVRITIEGVDRDVGWSVRLMTPDALLLVPAFLLLAAGVFLLISRFAGRSSVRIG